jgi:hypothetical protein
MGLGERTLSVLVYSREPEVIWPPRDLVVVGHRDSASSLVDAQANAGGPPKRKEAS